MKAFTTCACILLDGRLKGFNSPIQLLNIYGPFNQRKQFWDQVKIFGLLIDTSLIIVGDFNFTL